MKPLLCVAIKEAVRLALVDSTLAGEMDRVIPDEGLDAWLERADRVREQWARNPALIPGELLASLDADVLAQNLSCRLLGTGGWQIGDLYSGNATPQEIFDASIDRAHEDPTADVRMGLLDIGVESADITTNVDDLREGSGEVDAEHRGCLACIDMPDGAWCRACGRRQEEPAPPPEPATGLADAIRRARGDWTGEEVVAQIEAYNRGVRGEGSVRIVEVSRPRPGVTRITVERDEEAPDAGH